MAFRGIFGLWVLVMISMADVPALFGQAKKTMVITNRSDVSYEIAKWTVRHAGKSEDLEVEKEGAKVLYRWQDISGIEIARPQSAGAGSKSCSLTITLNKGKVVRGTVPYVSYFMEGNAEGGREVSMDLCLAKSISFK